MNRIDDDSRQVLFTVGHSNHPIERFLEILDGYGIELIVDVRSSPYSRHVPHFNKGRLAASLSAAGIRYLYLGNLLGGRQGGMRGSGPTQYQEASSGEGFREGIRILLNLSQQERCAVMCAERDPSRCHRKHLIARTIIERGVRPIHILADGSLLPEEECDPLFGHG